ncbi:MAG TPA: phenylalanine 4-monooxygenase [Polyangia bacterium]|jgi:phenylalanine-4-hydroxylase|nr:phenylalanine 4-monooxygenase [Polyangia bacterium]
MAIVPHALPPGSGLTTTKAAFIEEARAHGDVYIHQPYELYSAENHTTWGRLLARMHDRWEHFANHRYLEGLERLHLPDDHIPRIEEINGFMKPLTGFVARPVSGYVPSYVFFDCLRRREFPTTVTIRDGAHLEYLPEPDIFHDVAGHVPMHTDRAFADALVRFGECAAAAAEIASHIGDEHEKLRRLTSNIRAMSRFFWFSIEFGLMRANGALKAYGSGLLSSYGELAHAIEADTVAREPFTIERVVNQPFEIDHYQPLLFVVDGFDHLYALADELEDWIVQGRLDDVAPGEPAVSEGDLRSFLEAGAL